MRTRSSNQLLEAFFLVFILFTWIVPSLAQTTWILRVVNSAHYLPSEVNGLARGSMIVIFGYGLGPRDLVQASTFPLPKVLAKTSVRFGAAGAAVDGIMVYTSYNQVAAILPSNVPLGKVNVSVTFDGTASNEHSIMVVDSSPGLYTKTSDGLGLGIFTSPAYELQTVTKAARPGDTLVLWGTGLGPVSGDEAAGPLPGQQMPNISVEVGNRRANVLYAGRSGCCAGIDQIVFEVPTGVTGCLVPVVVRSGDVLSNYVVLPVSRDGGPCSDVGGGIPSEILAKMDSGERVRLGGIVMGAPSVLNSSRLDYPAYLAERLSSALGIRISKKDVLAVLAAHGARRKEVLRKLMRKYNVRPTIGKSRRMAAFRSLYRQLVDENHFGVAAGFGDLKSGASVIFQLGTILPSPGYCMVTRLSADSEPRLPNSTALDPGLLVLTGPVGTQPLRSTATGQYSARFPSAYDQGLPAGNYTVSASGGATVGSFTAVLPVGPALRWTNKPSTRLDRTQPLAVTWTSSGNPRYVMFGGAGANRTAASTFVCVEEASKGNLTVPQSVVSAMPATDSLYLFLSTYLFENRFSAPGLDLGFFANASYDWREVSLR